MVAFGEKPDADAVRDALKPVGGAVERVGSAEDVLITFVHLAAGGLHS